MKLQPSIRVTLKNKNNNQDIANHTSMATLTDKINHLLGG